MSNLQAVMDAIDKIEDGISETKMMQRQHGDEIMQLKQRGATLPIETASRASLGASIKTQFDKHRQTFDQAGRVSFKVPFNFHEIKATITTAAVQSNYQVQGLSYVPRPVDTMLMGAIENRPMPGVSTGHYSRYTHNSGSVAVQAGQGAEKAETNPVFTPIAQNAITVAGWCPITEQALATSGELESVVNTFLADGVLQGIDSVLIGGTAEVSWPFDGLKDLATPYPSLTYTDMADVVAETVAHMRWTGLVPSVVVLNPMSYLALILAKDLQGRYLSGTYMAALELQVHGCKVVFSSLLGVDEALVLDARHIQLGMSSELNIQIGYKNDDFTRNIRTIRAEAAIIPIFRHAGAARLATPAGD